MQSQSPPNILWACTEQQRWDTLGAYGNIFVETPVADRLAENGVLFLHAFCQSPTCTPNRVSFMTGRYPRTTRCRQNGQDIPEDELLITRLLKDRGYICGLVGKLDLSACHPSVTKGTERRIDDGYDVFHWSHDHSAIWPTNDYHHWLRDQGVSHKVAPFEDSRHVQIGMPEESHQTTYCADKAINFIQENASYNYPWFFSVNIFDPHHDFDPPRDYLERYLRKLADIPLPNYQPGELANKPIFQRNDHHNALNSEGWFDGDTMSEHDHRLLRAAYWAMCDLIDVQLGRILDALEETGQLDNTLIIFTSDHGEMLGDHGIYLKGPYFYEPAVRVPLIISMPGTIQSGQRVDGLVELTDIAPTLMEAEGLEIHPGMQGLSLWSFLTGASEYQSRDDVYSEYYNAMPFHRDPAAYATMIRTADYKLVAMHSLDSGELYDLNADPTETHNQWGNLIYAGVKMEMLQRLCNRMAWTVDPLPPRRSVW